MSKDGTNRGGCRPGARMGMELFETVSPRQTGIQAAKQAVTMAGAGYCPAGVMPVAIDNGFGGVIFHEACGHSLEATSVAVGQSQFCGKLGLRVPKDLSIVSFNNSLFSRITSPQLTTVDVNPYQLGMEAASQTINHIENPNLLATKIIVPHKLIPRESCCPPPEV